MNAVSLALTNVIGDAVNAAADNLVKGGNMPAFIKDDVNNVVEQSTRQVAQNSSPEAMKFVQDNVGTQLQDLFDRLFEGMLQTLKETQESNRPSAEKKIENDGKNIAEAAVSGKSVGEGKTANAMMESNGGKAAANVTDGGGSGENNWFVSLAIALGSIMNQQSTKIQNLSTGIGDMFTDISKAEKKAEENNGEGQDEITALKGKRFESIQILQAEAQVFSMLSQVVQNVVSTIGQGMSTVSRKQ